MTNFNLINFLLFYLLLIGLAIIFHYFLIFQQNNYPKKMNRRKKYWQNTFLKMKDSNNYRLNFFQKHLLFFEIDIFAFMEVFLEHPYPEIIDENQEEIFKFWSKVKSDTKKGYLAYLIAQITNTEHLKSPSLANLMLKYIKNSDSLYVRENALLTLNHYGSPDLIVEAFQIINQKNIYHNERLLLNGLKQFQGSSTLLAHELMEHFWDWSEYIQNTIIQYLIFTKNRDFDAILLDYIEDQSNQYSLSIDLKCQILRHLSANHDYPTISILNHFLITNYNQATWQLAAVAASEIEKIISIQNHPLIENTPTLSVENRLLRLQIIEHLKTALTSSYWYVRYNSAKALIHFDITKEDIASVFQGTDQYAKDILNYMLCKNLKEDLLNELYL